MDIVGGEEEEEKEEEGRGRGGGGEDGQGFHWRFKKMRLPVLGRMGFKRLTGILQTKSILLSSYLETGGARNTICIKPQRNEDFNLLCCV